MPTGSDRLGAGRTENISFQNHPARSSPPGDRPRQHRECRASCRKAPQESPHWLAQLPNSPRASGCRGGWSGRLKCIKAEITYSATALVLLPGRFATGTPRAVAAVTGMKSSPTPCRTMPRSQGAWIHDIVGHFRADHDASSHVRGKFAKRLWLRIWRNQQARMWRGIASPSGWIGFVNKTSGFSAIEGTPSTTGLIRGAKSFDPRGHSRPRLKPCWRFLDRRNAGRRARCDDISGFECPTLGRYEINAVISNSMSRVDPFCRTLSIHLNPTRNAWGSGTSSLDAMNGPNGPKVGMFLPRLKCPSPRMSSLALTSLKTP